MDILWTRQASRQLAAAYTYMDQANARAAGRRQVNAILDAVEQLSRFPDLGRPGRVEGTRELAIGGTPYVVGYRIREGSIRVLALLHGAQRWPTFLHEGLR